jgi:hypothetical protein
MWQHDVTADMHPNIWSTVKWVPNTVSATSEGSTQRIPKPTASHVPTQIPSNTQTRNPSHEYPCQLKSPSYDMLCRVVRYTAGTLVPIYQTTRRYTPKDLKLNTDRPQTLKPHPSPPQLLYLQGFPTKISVYIHCFPRRKFTPIAPSVIDFTVQTTGHTAVGTKDLEIKCSWSRLPSVLCCQHFQWTFIPLNIPHLTHFRKLYRAHWHTVQTKQNHRCLRQKSQHCVGRHLSEEVQKMSNLSTHGKMLLKWILQNYDVRVRTGFVWLRIRTSYSRWCHWNFLLT